VAITQHLYILRRSNKLQRTNKLRKILWCHSLLREVILYSGLNCVTGKLTRCGLKDLLVPNTCINDLYNAISQPYKPPRPVTGTALLYFTFTRTMQDRVRKSNILTQLTRYNETSEKPGSLHWHLLRRKPRTTNH
jgi:hypothetical protein